MLMPFRTAYHILIDRFAGCKGRSVTRPEFAGGTIAGIVGRLDYLEWLGIDAIWLSPFLRTSAYHGYHVTDFFRIEPRFGELEDLVKLIDESHRRGMKVYADFVANHCSYMHSFFMEAQAEPRSRFRDWFTFDSWPQSYLTFPSAPELPKLNLRNEETCRHIMDSALYWLSWGLDGLRLDHAIGPELNFWKQFRRQIKEAYPSALLVGEVWLDRVSRHHMRALGVANKTRRMLFGLNVEALYSDYVAILDGVLDFWLHDRLPGIAVAHALEHYSRFPSDFVLPAFLDNHDVDRFMFRVKNDEAKLKDGAQKLFSLPQPVLLYFGTEIGMTQPESIHSRIFGDNLARQPMNWESPNQGLREFFRTLIHKRRLGNA